MMKIYNGIFLFCVFFVTLLSASIMLWSQPITGDLTRISAYPERWFGWNDQQQNIPIITNSLRTDKKRHILVVGDSFSEAGHWQAYLSEQYSFSFIHNGKTTLSKIIDAIDQKKPDAIIIETAERAFLDMYGAGSTFIKSDHHCELSALNSKNETATTSFKAIDKITTLPQFPLMERKTLPAEGKSISEGFHALKIWAKSIMSPRKRKAKTLAITRKDLFSNQRSDQILLLSRDFLLYDSADEKSVTAIRCSMQKTASLLAQKNIPYVLLAIPDKTTAYQPYLADEAIRQRPALINRLHVNQIKHGIDMLPPIQAMAAAGHKDIYLPDDTHWGYKGYQLAAALIAMELDTQWSAKNIQQHD